MAARARRLTRGRPGAAGTLGLALVALTIVCAVGATVVVDGARRDADRGRAAGDLGRLDAALDLVTAATARTAADPAAVSSITDRRLIAESAIATSPLVGVIFTDEEGAVRDVVVAPRVTTAPGRLAADVAAGVGAALDVAGASGVAEIAAPVTAAGVATVVVVAPSHAPGTPAAVGERRRALAGFVLGVVPIDELVGPEGEPLWPNAAVEIRSPDDVIYLRGNPSDPVLRDRIDVRGAPWTATVGPRSRGVSPVVPVVVALGLAGAAAATLVVGAQERRRRRAEADALARSRQLELVAETSTNLQQSLELSELLPAFAVVSWTELGLEEVRIEVANAEGAMVEAFRLGAAPPSAETYELPLRRTWRLVGMVRVAVSRPLDAAEQQTLGALTDLLAVAISNAQLYQREQDAVTRLQELDALKNAFLGTVSHELRTSTTTVMGFGELLSESWDALSEERRRELARRIRRAAGSLRHLVDDLLDYARLEHDTLRMSPRVSSLTSITAEIVESMRPLISEHTLVLELADEVDAHVDPLAVERILANLLTNAAKYAPAGSAITVAVEEADGRARLRVMDHGPGIPQEERDRVFVRFYRMANAETIRTRGAGIGLAIVRDFVDQSAATIRIDETPGGGATFVVDFPVSPAPSELAEDANPQRVP